MQQLIEDNKNIPKRHTFPRDDKIQTKTQTSRGKGKDEVIINTKVSEHTS